MAGLEIRVEARAGRISFDRAAALNALNGPMMTALDQALRDWADDDRVDLIVIDALGERAFCAGGDIAEIYAQGRAGNFGFGQRFWADEYRMNARIAGYPKPIVSLMQGFTMGGGVGVGCHASHRITGETSQIAMPECGIGLVPDVGGSFLLAQGPGHLGAYLGTTGSRMGPADAIYAGFADHFVPQADWPALIAALLAGGIAALPGFVKPAPQGRLPALQSDIDKHFAGADLGAIVQSLQKDSSDFAQATLKTLQRGAPLASCATVEIQRLLGKTSGIQAALALEYRYTFRAQQQGDFLEGIRAAIIDKDRSPKWQHPGIDAVRPADVAAMLAPLGTQDWTWEDQA